VNRCRHPCPQRVALGGLHLRRTRTGRLAKAIAHIMAREDHAREMAEKEKRL
jgi:hypothetical protein